MPTQIETVMGLLQTMLERSGRSLLTVVVTNYGKPPYGPAFDLLAAHADRWRTVSLYCYGSVLDALSSVKDTSSLEIL